MPNRMLRDWTNSDKVNILSYQAEVFFVRLIMKADDYGCFWADAKRLKSNLYPLKSDSVRDADILRWMAECHKAGLIVIYESDGKKYLQIDDYGQRLRQKKSKFPMPENDSTLLTNDSNVRPELEEKKKLEVEEEGKELHPHNNLGKWNTKPGPDSLSLELPEITSGAIVQQFRITKNIRATKEQVAGLWSVFKAQNFNGEKYYSTAKQVFSHFINWSQTKDIKDSHDVTQVHGKSKEDDNLEKLRKLHGPNSYP